MITTQFESLYFGRLNTIKPALPIMRRQRSGHILVLTGTTAAMGHPGMSIRCAADHAIEGLLDALAFELAPFGIKVTTIQPSIEASVWANGVDVTPPSPQYDFATLRTVRGMAGVVEAGKAAGVVESAVEETVRVVAAVAGSDNPPGRITVGEEGVELVKERLKTLSEELEEYLDASLSADIVSQGSGTGRGSSAAAAGQQEGGEE
jgi:NAD(P)-dependent dehydrogenase (short-subunit alcohol dehydrogenase family)